VRIGTELRDQFLFQAEPAAISRSADAHIASRASSRFRLSYSRAVGDHQGTGLNHPSGWDRPVDVA
jgi:hypothetical protein